ncbi:MAG: hypothetical protein JW932_08540 [Deltaproteobacteria bacterium]|nr:hypothetical protein [Deltaproteobacteria bacterium]
MKSMNKENLAKIKKMLTVAYYEKETVEIGESWKSRVMASIQDLRPSHQVDFIEVFQRILWRLVPVACGLIILLGIAVSQMNLISDYELVDMMFEDPADYSLLALNGY